MITNPLAIYLVAWVGVLFLYSLKLTTNLVPMSGYGLVMIFVNIMTIFVFYFLTGCYKKKITLNGYELLFLSGVVKSYARIILFIWFLGTIIEIVYSSGFPLLWKFIGSSKLYTEFGVPSFHGIMNALYLQLLTMFAYIYAIEKKKKYIVYIILLLFWPIFMLGRGIFLSAVIQMVCVFLFYYKLKPSLWLKLFVLLMIVVVGFGYVGDLRQTANPFSYLIESPDSLLHSLPSGFLWFYVYLTAGLSNLFFNIDLISPTYNFTFSFSNMLPSIVRGFFELDSRNDLFTFVDVNLNTSTIYAGFVSDFGIVGGIILVSIIQFICCMAYSGAMKGRPWAIFSYTVAFQILIFSVFYDMFFLLPTLFQFVVCFGMYIAYRVKARKFYR